MSRGFAGDDGRPTVGALQDRMGTRAKTPEEEAQLREALVLQKAVKEEQAKRAARKAAARTIETGLKPSTVEQFDFAKNKPDIQDAIILLSEAGFGVEAPVHGGGINISLVFEPIEGDLYSNDDEDDVDSSLTSIRFAKRHDVKDRRRMLVERLDGILESVNAGNFDNILGDGL